MSGATSLTTALIGATGFVGSTLLQQRGFDRLYRSTDIEAIRGQEFSLVVCAGAPGHKWLANRDPAADHARLAALTGPLSSVRCEQFVLISTVDVFADPRGVDEESIISEWPLEPYGMHRWQLEQFVRQTFPDSLIVRLPGLVGPGLRKNALYDLHNQHRLTALDSRSIYQFYPTAGLWRDIQRALECGLQTVHLTAEPVSLGEIAQRCFGHTFTQTGEMRPAEYDLQSLHAARFGARGRYQYSARESLDAIRAYARSEPRRRDG